MFLSLFGSTQEGWGERKHGGLKYKVKTCLVCCVSTRILLVCPELKILEWKRTPAGPDKHRTVHGASAVLCLLPCG